MNNLVVFAGQEGPYYNPQMRSVLKQEMAEPNYFTMLFGLFFVIFLIYLTSFFYQKLVGINSKISKKVLDLPDVNKVKIISSTPIGQGQNIHVAIINGKYLLLGATSSSINLLREFDENEIKDYQDKLNNSCNSTEEE